MKVKFKNNSRAHIAYIGKPRIEIPGNAEMVMELPDSERMRDVIGTLKARYATLDVSILPTEAESHPSTPVSYNSFDEFQAVAVVEEKAAGWATVTVPGLEPFKVRATKESGKEPVELAWEAFQGKEA